ncbi:MAG: NADH-quinone oxidoreductase subunit M [Anaerolineales bacterium]|nr:NADH-quinone oxidoreductase subunit M [Anaerolineales bacterium]
MILFWLILGLLTGGLLAWLAGRWSATWPRWIALGTLTLELAALLALWFVTKPGLQAPVASSGGNPWLLEVSVPWIPQLGVQFHLALDGLSLIMLLLVNLLGSMAVATSWRSVQKHTGFFHFNILWILAALTGVFLAVDLFLFYFFWEMMLVPLYFLVGIWGHENRIYATLKFFVFTQAGGLLMLLAILGLYVIHGQTTGVYTFDYQALMDTPLSLQTAVFLMFGFFAAFAVKLPAVPFHTWLPDAHTEAPTAGSVLLAGLVLKAGAYGLIRFLIPLFPAAALEFAPTAMIIAVIGILYGALLAFAQTDLKRLVAYTSVSHMGFVMLGIFAWNPLALQGAIMVIVAHGLSTGALFILVGDLYDRLGTRDLNRMGGLWETAPRMGRIGLILALASLGLPGMANFVGEFLVLQGAYEVSRPLTVLATLGFVLASLYSLWMLQRIFTGPNQQVWQMSDTTPRELAIYTVFIALLLLLGLYPRPVLQTTQTAVQNLQQLTTAPSAARLESGEGGLAAGGYVDTVSYRPTASPGGYVDDVQ